MSKLRAANIRLEDKYWKQLDEIAEYLFTSRSGVIRIMLRKLGTEKEKWTSAQIDEKEGGLILCGKIQAR